MGVKLPFGGIPQECPSSLHWLIRMHWTFRSCHDASALFHHTCRAQRLIFSLASEGWTSALLVPRCIVGWNLWAEHYYCKALPTLASCAHPGHGKVLNYRVLPRSHTVHNSIANHARSFPKPQHSAPLSTFGASCLRLQSAPLAPEDLC